LQAGGHRFDPGQLHHLAERKAEAEKKTSKLLFSKCFEGEVSMVMT
jgi:hypothetical protein